MSKLPENDSLLPQKAEVAIHCAFPLPASALLILPSPGFLP
jgi:hypothetical protein